jgi:U3 small nucleolar RNA-associated protein 10
MSTELQRQVALLKKKDVVSAPIHSGAPSLFLDAKEAAKVDMLDVYNAALKGIEILCQYNENFELYLDTIFHASSVSLQRELKTAAENDVLNSELSSLFNLLSLYCTLPEAHTVLEYLIRRYRAHEFNTADLVGCMITQHDTKV